MTSEVVELCFSFIRGETKQFCVEFMSQLGQNQGSGNSRVSFKSNLLKANDKTKFEINKSSFRLISKTK